MTSPAHHANWNREEAAMAAITFNTVQGAGPGPAQDGFSPTRRQTDFRAF